MKAARSSSRTRVLHLPVAEMSTARPRPMEISVQAWSRPQRRAAAVSGIVSNCMAGRYAAPASGVESHEPQLEILMRPATVQVLVPHADQWWPVPAPLAADPNAADAGCSRLT